MLKFVLLFIAFWKNLKLNRTLRLALYTLHFTLYIYSSASAQHKLKIPGPKDMSQCKDCEAWFNSLNENIHVGLTMDDNRMVYLVSNSEDFFSRLLEIKGIGLAVELVTRDMYSCESKAEFPPIGKVLNVVDRKYLKKNASINDNHDVRVPLATVPAEFEIGDFEVNLLYLKNDYICSRNIFYNVETTRWNLLDMGLFLDTIITKEQSIYEKKSKGGWQTQRVLTFTVPFEKSKFNYSPADLQPMHDSLNLKKYTIKSIDIEAYASVEGSTENNLMLQKKRAESIVAAVQTFQNDSIKGSIKTEENWGEFYADIENTKWDKLSDISKQELKEKLNSKVLLNELEPTLKKHRKAVVNITQERIELFQSLSNEKLIARLDLSVKEKNISEAQNLETELFYRILNQKADTGMADSPQIPEDADYSLLLQNRSAFKYYLGSESAVDMLADYEKQAHLHDNVKSAYNYFVLLCNAFLEKPEERIFTKAKEVLKDLKAFNLAPSTMEKLNVNLSLLQAEFYGYKKEYPARDKAITDLYKKYYKASLPEKDALSFAKYLVSYDKIDAAKKMLAPYAGRVNCNEDLLFYYINITVLDKKVSTSSSYKSVLQNAVNKNKPRFCILYNTPDNRGISFQILTGKLFKKYYCEYCDK